MDYRSLVHRWADLSEDAPMSLVKRRRVVGAKVMVSQVRLARGFVVPRHQHENEQIAMVMSGRIRFALGEPSSPEFREVELVAGEVLHLPSNLPHGAEAIEDTLVYDVFSPVSEGTGIDRK